MCQYHDSRLVPRSSIFIIRDLEYRSYIVCLNPEYIWNIYPLPDQTGMSWMLERWKGHIYHTTKTIFGKDQRMPATGYISYPTLSASLTHCIWQWVRIFMLMHACHHAFSFSSADTLMYFRRNRDGFEQVVLLVFVLTFSTLCRIKIISFCSLKNGKIVQWLSGMINSLLGALGCRIRIISSLGTSYTGSASGLTVYEFLD